MTEKEDQYSISSLKMRFEWNFFWKFTLIDIDDINQLQKAMRLIVANYNNYDLRSISEECLKSCSEDSVINALINTFNEVVK